MTKFPHLLQSGKIGTMTLRNRLVMSPMETIYGTPDGLPSERTRDYFAARARALLGSDPTAPASRVVAGVPLLTSPSIVDGIVWALPKSRVIVALRQGTEVTTDTSAFFTSHRVAVRAVLRIGWAFTDVAAVSKIAITP